MLQSEEKRVRENIKAAWNEGDIFKLLCAGFDSFMNAVCNSAPLPFQSFLEYTGISFDKYIQDIAVKEHLNFVAGKMTLELDGTPVAESTPVRLSADFYFQTKDKQWIIKKKRGVVESSRFSDWESDIDAQKLKATGKMELSIEPPKAEDKRIL